MIRKLIHKLLAPRHPWRTISFSELSEMYIAGMLKNFAQGMIGVFVPLYLLNKGYSFQVILFYYALLYALGVAVDYLSARLTARLGPKHVMRLGFLMQFITAIALAHIDVLPYPLLIIAFFHTSSGAFYWLPYHVDFSKVKHAKHGGAEVGWVNILERVGGIAGPLAGGIIGAYFGGSALFFVAAVVLLIAIVVLMLSPEPMHTSVKLTFKNRFKLNDWRTHISYSSFVTENSVGMLLWPTFLAAVVFTNNAYIKIGTVVSLSVVAAIVIALPLGKLVDNQKGRKLLNYGVNTNSLVHLSRLATGGFIGAAIISALKEPTTLLYRIAFSKGFYDKADDFGDGRISYIAQNEMIAHGLCAIFWASLAIASMYVSPYVVCAIGFILAAILSQLIRLQQFPALRE